MRTSFELKTTASTMAEAAENATKILAKFLGVPESAVVDKVNVELKIQMPEDVKTIEDIDAVSTAGGFVVSIYGLLKQGYVLPFGTK
jgi:hypothetical protein